MKLVPPVPMWQQVAGHLRGEILAGTYPPGQLLPSEETLAAEFGVSRPTVRQGIQALAAEGLVEIRRPRGTMVRDPTAAPARTEHHTPGPPLTAGTAGDWADTGEPRFYRADATVDLATLLGIPPGEPMLVRETRQHTDGLGRLTRLCMPFSVAAGTPWADNPHLPPLPEIRAYFTPAGHILTTTDYIRARMPIGDETTALATPAGTPLLIVTSITSGLHGRTWRPLLLHETRTRADQLQLAYTLPANPQPHPGSATTK